MKKILSIVLSIIFFISIIVASLSFVSNKVINEEISNNVSSHKVIKEALDLGIKTALNNFGISIDDSTQSYIDMATTEISNNKDIQKYLGEISDNLINDIDSNSYSDMSEIEKQLNNNIADLKPLITQGVGKDNADSIINEIKKNMDLQPFYNDEVDELRGMAGKDVLNTISLAKKFSSDIVFMSSLLISIISFVVLVVLHKDLKMIGSIGVPSLLDAIVLYISSFSIDAFLEIIKKKYGIAFVSEASHILQMISLSLLVVFIITIVLHFITKKKNC